MQLVDWSDAPEDKAEPHGPVVVYPPREAPLWRNLRALHWFCDQLGARPPAVSGPRVAVRCRHDRGTGLLPHRPAMRIRH